MSKDPINAVPDYARVLFERLGREAEGFTAPDVSVAALNLLINAIRQSKPTWREAEKEFDERLGFAKQVLKNQYDSVGRLRGVYPYDQTINIDALLVNESLIRKQ